MVRFAIIFLFIVCIVFPGCSEQSGTFEQESQSPAVPRPGGVYRAPLLHDPSTLDPAFVQDEYGVTLIHKLFDGLVRFGPDLIVLPALAESWTVQEDGRVYQFALREDARFHDGSAVTASDVVFSLSRLLRIKAESAILPYLLMIEGAEEYRAHTRNTVTGLAATGDTSVTITLKQPYIPFLTALGLYQAKVVPRHVVVEEGPRFGKSPVGSGPFRFSSWIEDTRILLKRFTDYYGGPAYLDAVQYRIYPGGETDLVLEEFKKGKLHEMPLFGGIRNELGDEVTLFQRPSLSLLFYGMRVDKPPLNDPLLRQAIALCFDKEEIGSTIYHGQFEPAGRVLPPGLPGYVPPEQSLQGNLEKAQQLMQQVRGPNTAPIPLEIVSASQSSFAQSELGYAQERLAKIGIDLKIRYIADWAQFETYIQSDEVQLYRYLWTADMPDPDNFFSPLFSKGSTVNYMRYSNPQVETLLAKARRSPDPIDRRDIYHQVEKILSVDTPCIPLFYLSVDRAYSPVVQNIEISALGPVSAPLHRVWLSESWNE